MVESTLELNYQKEAKRRMSLLYRVKTKKGLVCFLTIIASNKHLSSAFSNWTGDLIQPFRKTLFDQLQQPAIRQLSINFLHTLTQFRGRGAQLPNILRREHKQKSKQIPGSPIIENITLYLKILIKKNKKCLSYEGLTVE